MVICGAKWIEGAPGGCGALDEDGAARDGLPGMDIWPDGTPQAGGAAKPTEDRSGDGSRNPRDDTSGIAKDIGTVCSD
jgi:hypothetical protein